MNKLEAIEALKQVDIEFCNECKINGADGWVKYFTEDGIMATSGGREDIIGKALIHKAISNVFNLEKVSFTWEPVYCDVSDDFTLGHTSGTSTLKYIKDGKEIVDKGKYSSIWKKTNGEWKVILDLGN